MKFLVRIFTTTVGLLCIGGLALALPASAAEDEAPEVTVTFESVSLPDATEPSDQVLDLIAAGGTNRYVAIDAAALMDDLQSAGSVNLRLFSDVELTLSPTQSHAGVVGSRFWAGSSGSTSASFTELSGVIDARIVDLDTSTLYRIVGLDRQIHFLAEDRVSYPEELEVTLPAEFIGGDLPGGASEEATGAARGDIRAAAGPQVDVLAWYDQGALAIWGTSATAEAAIAASYNMGNSAAVASGANVMFNVVEIAQTTWSPSSNAGTALTSIRSQTDGVLDSIHAARDAAGADLVAVLGDLSGGCGIGYVPTAPPNSGSSSIGFTYTDAACVGGNLTLVHETGHNFGAGHDSGASSPGPGLYSYSQGYVNPTAGYRTIMSYTTACSGCLRVPYFSNPTALYLGNPTGDAGKDNARTLTESAAGIASYRDSPVDVEAPDSLIAAPGSGSVVSGSPVVLSGSSTDNVGVTDVRLTIYETSGFMTWDGSAFTATYSTVTASLASPGSTSTGWTYDLAGAPETGVSFTARAYDAASNVDPSTPWRGFTINNDTTAPDTAITAPNSGSVVAGSPIELSGTSTDDVGVTRVRLTIYETAGFMTWDGTSFTAPYTTVDASLASPGGTSTGWTYDMVGPPEAGVSFTARAYDAAGNVDPSTPWRGFTINNDTTSPDSVIIAPAAGSMESGFTPIELSGTSTDDVGVTRVRLTIYETAGFMTWDGTSFTAPYTTVDASLASPGGTSTGWTYDMVGPPEAGVSFTARAYDAAGNVDPSTPWRGFTIIGF